MVPGLGCLYIWDLGVSFKTVMTSVTTLYNAEFFFEPPRLFHSQMLSFMDDNLLQKLSSFVVVGTKLKWGNEKAKHVPINYCPNSRFCIKLNIKCVLFCLFCLVKLWINWQMGDKGPKLLSMEIPIPRKSSISSESGIP